MKEYPPEVVLLIHHLVKNKGKRVSATECLHLWDKFRSK